MQCTQVTFDLQATQNFLDENNGIGLLFVASLNVDGTIISSPNLNPFLPIGIPPDLADFETEADEENCRVQFTSLGDEELINTHSWDFGDGSSGSAAANPIHTFPGSGTYIVTHTVSNFCGTVVEEIEVEVNCPFTCPCFGAGAINIDAGSGLSILNTPIPSLVASTGFGPQTLVNTCLAINGRLLIDQLYDLVILGGEIRMQPGAEIVVQNGSELDLIAIIANNGIHGCEQMWQGITVLNGGSLIMNSVNIEDAQYAVEVNDGSTLDVTFTEFDRNYVGIYVPHSPGGSLQVVNQPFPLQKNSFTCSSSLLPPFVGQSPNPGTISFAGIQLNNVFFNVGSSSVPTATNDFSLVKNGIVAENQSVVGVFNASFLNLEGTVNIDLTIPSSAAFTGIGVYLNETYAYAVDNNSFTGDDDRAIHANNSSLFAKQNTAKTFIGISIEEGNFNLIDIQKNKFDFIKRGIQVLNTEAPSFFDIDQNIFTHLVAGPPSSLARGITIIEPTISSSLSILKRINRNQFNLTNYSAGIGLFNSWEYDVNYNNIFFSNPNLSPPLGGLPIGMAISGGGNNLLYQDTISAGNLSDRVVGFNWASSPGNILCCNLASNLLTAFNAQGPCDNTRLRNSIIENNFRGLSCSRGTIISDQNFAGNLWTGTYSDYSARHFSTPLEVMNSQFTVEPPIVQPLWPPAPIIPGSWFLANPLSFSLGCTQDEICLPVPPQEREETELNTTDSETARGAFLEASFGATSDWEMKRSLYRRLSRHEQLTGQNAIVDSFFLASGNTSLGDFQNVDEQIASSLRVDAATLAQLNFYKSSIDSSTAQLAVIDSLYAYAFMPEDSVQLAQQKAELLNQLISPSENLMATLMTLKVNRESQTNQILGMNEAINASILPA
jgi:PKD repeat protein